MSEDALCLSPLDETSIEKAIYRAILKTWHTGKRKNVNARITAAVAMVDVMNLIREHEASMEAAVQPYDISKVIKPSVDRAIAILQEHGYLPEQPDERPFRCREAFSDWYLKHCHKYPSEDARAIFEAGWNARPTERESKAVSALQRLVELKRYKDKYGKDARYETQQPLAWEEALAALNQIEGQKP